MSFASATNYQNVCPSIAVVQSALNIAGGYPYDVLFQTAGSNTSFLSPVVCSFPSSSTSGNLQWTLSYNQIESIPILSPLNFVSDASSVSITKFVVYKYDASHWRVYLAWTGAIPEGNFIVYYTAEPLPEAQPPDDA